jgi:membrane-associated phospholipid phosphatase
VYSIIGGILLDKPIYIFFGLYVIMCDACSSILKLLTKQIYKGLGRESIPLLGLGRRPDGAKFCSAFITESNPTGITESFGMPSGHALVAGMTFTFWLNYIREHTEDDKLRRRQYVLLGIICAAVVISRFYLGCHTIQQSLLGAVIGSGLGIVGYKYLYRKVLYYIDYYNLLNL